MMRSEELSICTLRVHVYNSNNRRLDRVARIYFIQNVVFEVYYMLAARRALGEDGLGWRRYSVHAKPVTSQHNTTEWHRDNKKSSNNYCAIICNTLHAGSSIEAWVELSFISQNST